MESILSHGIYKNIIENILELENFNHKKAYEYISQILIQRYLAYFKVTSPERRSILQHAIENILNHFHQIKPSDFFKLYLYFQQIVIAQWANNSISKEQKKKLYDDFYTKWHTQLSRVSFSRNMARTDEIQVIEYYLTSLSYTSIGDKDCVNNYYCLGCELLLKTSPAEIKSSSNKYDNKDRESIIREHEKTRMNSMRQRRAQQQNEKKKQELDPILDKGFNIVKAKPYHHSQVSLAEKLKTLFPNIKVGTRTLRGEIAKRDDIRKYLKPRAKKLATS